MMSDPLVIAEDIWDFIRSGDCVVWIGAGFSHIKQEDLIKHLDKIGNLHP